MEVKTVKISELKPHPKNPRVHPDSALDKLVKSIQEFGWTNPVLASADGIILAGHARVRAAEKAGITEVPVIYLPFEGAKADAYLVADNKLQDETDWDMPFLRDLLKELETGGLDMGLTGFDDSELDKLMTDSTPVEIEELLSELDMTAAIEKPIWVSIRTDAANREKLEAGLRAIEENGIRVERSYG